MLILLAIFWVFGGIYLLYKDWVRDLDLKVSNVLVIILGGAIIGPLIGMANCIEFGFKTMFPKNWDTVLVKSERK